MPCCQGLAMREHTKTKIHRMLAAGVIEPATSERALPVVFASTKDSTLRLC